MLSEQGISPTDFTQAFVQFDTDGNGTIEREEFYDIVENHMNLGLSKKEMRAMWRCIDVDGDNSIDITEFAAVRFDADVGLIDNAAAELEKKAEGEGEDGEAKGGIDPEAIDELKRTVKAAVEKVGARVEAIEGGLRAHRHGRGRAARAPSDAHRIAEENRRRDAGAAARRRPARRRRRRQPRRPPPPLPRGAGPPIAAASQS